MFKRLLSVMLSLAAVFCFSAAVSADSYTEELSQSEGMQALLEQGVTVGDSAVMVRPTDILQPYDSYDKLAKSSSFRTAVLRKDGEAVGHIAFAYRDGAWVYTNYSYDGSYLQDIFDQYGTDIVVFGGYEKMFVAKSQPDTVLPLEPENAKTLAGGGNPLPYDDYIAFLSYRNMAAGSTDPKYMGGGNLKYSVNTVAAAKEYWQQHPQHSFGWVWIAAAVAVIAGLAAIIYLRRKRKTQ